eukprot:6199940-Prymnesium_polylepis.1
MPYFRPVARPGCSPTAKNRGGAAEPVAGAKPVSIVKNISGNLLDGGAEPHDLTLTDDAGDRAGCLDDDEQCVQVELRRARSRSSHRLVG